MRAVGALARHGAVAFAPTAQARVEASLFVDGNLRSHVPVAVVATDRSWLWSSVVFSPARAAGLGLRAEVVDAVVRSPRPLTTAQRRALDELAYSEFQHYRQVQGRMVYLNFDRPVATSQRTQHLVLGAAVALTLGVVGLGLALAAAESRHEQALLQALGTPPRAARRVRVVQAATLAGLGGVLAVPVGFGPTAAHLGGPGSRPVVFPTGAAMAVAVIIPVASPSPPRSGAVSTPGEP